MNLIKVAPFLTKIVVSGWGVDDMELKIRNGEELTVPKFADGKIEEFSVTYQLKESVSPNGLRLAFKARRVELYEIEVF